VSSRPLALSFAATFLIQLLGVASGVLLARGLGPASRGELAAVIIWPAALAALGSMGIPDAVTVKTSLRAVPGGRVLGTSLVLSLLQSAALVLLALAFLPLFLRNQTADTVQLALVFLAFIPLNLASLALLAYLNGAGRYRSFQVLRASVFVLVTAALAALVAANTLTVESAALAYLGANLAVLVAAAAAVVRSRPGRLAADRRTARNLLGFGLRSHLGNVASLLNERLDQLVISMFLAPTLLGYYVIAVTMSSAVTAVGSTVSIVAMPVVARLVGMEDVLPTIRRYLLVTLGAAGAAAVLCFALAPSLIDLLFGQGFAPATDAARVLLAAAVALSSGRVLSAVLRALGRPLSASVGDMIGLLVTVATLPVLLVSLGITGAALASLIAYTVSFAWLLRRVASSLEVPARALFWPPPQVTRPAAPGGTRP
jgi:O-antigen/teichoic acid export membrane protein